VPERLTLKSDPSKWFDLKSVYTMGDKEDVHGYANLGVSDGGNTYQLNPVKFRTGQVAARILNWNLAREVMKKNKDGKLEVVEDVIPWDAAAPFMKRVALLRTIDEELVEELYDLLRAHTDQREAAKAAEQAIVADLEEQAEKNAQAIDAPD
jgi:hypothetical protein